MAGNPKKRARKLAGLPPPEPIRATKEEWQAIALARAPAPAHAPGWDPSEDPDGVKRAILRRFAEEAISSEELTPVAIAAGKVVLDEIARVLPKTMAHGRARTATEVLDAVRAALPELEAKARAENEAAGTETPVTVAVDTGSW